MHAVITGHIVDKSLRTPQEWVQALKSVLNGFGSEPLDWQLFRGDSFQLVIDEPQNALLTALRIRAAFKVAMGQDLQLAIGIGTVDFGRRLWQNLMVMHFKGPSICSTR